MYKKFVNALYVLNIAFQSFFTLLVPIGLGAFVSYLLTSYARAPGWIWAPVLIFGVLCGLYSMVKFVLSAMAGLERLEKQQNYKAKNKNVGNTNEKE